jgi:hypothetical protein
MQTYRPFDRLRKRKVPEFLWHYTSASGLFGIIQSECIWATKIQFLNDSREFIEATNLCRSLLQQIAEKQSESWPKQLVAFLAKSLGSIENANVCVCSFTEEQDLLSQWRGYCPPEGGYCLGINSDALIKNFSVLDFTILPCVYDYSTQQELLNDVVEIVLPELLKLPQTSPGNLAAVAKPIVERFFLMIHEIAPIIKVPGFAEEKEWRAVSAPNTFNKLKVRPQGGLLKPYFEVPLKLQAAKVRVVVGPGTHMELVMDACGILAASKHPVSVQIDRSSIPFRSL